MGVPADANPVRIVRFDFPHPATGYALGIDGEGPVRLNLGAGNQRIAGWFSVGLEEQHDIRADLRAVPLPDECADTAMAIHVLEHFERWEAPNALREWFRLLKPGGLLILELPDVVKCARAVMAEDEPRAGLWGLYGDPAHRDPLMLHRWGWSARELAKELKACGFVKVRTNLPLEFHARRAKRDMRIEARKPAAEDSPS